MAKDPKERRAELKTELKAKIEALIELNNKIDSVKMTGSYQDWYKKYAHIKSEIEAVKNSKEMNMERYQSLMREYRNIKREKPAEMVELQDKKAKLQQEIVQIQSELKGKTVKKEEPTVQAKEDSQEKKVGVVEYLQQLTELQVACSRIQTAQRRKALVELLATVAEVVDVKLTAASSRFKNGKSEIKSIQEEFKARTDEISRTYQEVMSGFEEKKQGLEEQYTDVIAKIHKKDVDIEFWKKRVSGKQYDKKAYIQWRSTRKKIDEAMKKLESLETMSKEQMAQYSKLAKQKAALDSKPEYTNNPLIKMILERESLVQESMTIDSQMVQLEQQRTEARTEFIQEFAQATEDKENKLAVVEKPGFIGKVVASIADRFNAKKRFNDEVRTPMQHFIQKLQGVSQGLQTRTEQIIGNINGDGKEEKSGSLLEKIERSRKNKHKIIDRLIAVLQGREDDSKTKAKENPVKAKPALETGGMEL